MEFKSTRTGNSVYDEMKARIFGQRLFERNEAYKKFEYDDELVDALEMIEDEYVFNLFKLDEINLLQYQSEEIKEKFCNQKLYIDNSNISAKQKNNIILTTVCLCTRIYEQIKHLSEEQLYLLGVCMEKAELKDYSIYGQILTDKHFITRANEMANDENGILELEQDAFIFCDECNGCELSNPSYQKVMKRVLPIVYKKSTVK